MPYLFSYGSNSTAQLVARVRAADAAALCTQPARVPGFVRIFCCRSAGWGDGGVASIFPAEEQQPGTEGGGVRGTVSRLTDEQLALLDSFESSYTQQTVTAFVPKSAFEGGGEEAETEDRKE